MEPVQAAENPAGADVRHGDWRLGYPLVAVPVIALCAGILDGRPWAAGFAFGLLLLGVGSIWRDMLALERAQAERGRAAVNAALDNHHEAAVLHDRHLIWRLRLGYFVLAPVMSVCAGLLDGPSAGYFAYAPLLLLGVASIGWSLLPLPPRPPQRVRRPREGGAAANDAGNHQIAPPEAAIAWCGYVLVAAPVMGASFGLADTAAAALVSYALVLLGFAFLSVAMLPLRPMERILREEDRPVRNDNFVAPRARGMDWTGYFFVAAPVMASCAGLVDGLAAALFFYALHLLGVVFIIIAMLALAKQNMA